MPTGYEKMRPDIVSNTWALDTNLASLGAPGKPGEVRVVDSVVYGTQFYKLLLNESGSAITVVDGGLGVAVATGTAWAGPTIAGLSGTATVVEKWAGVVVTTLADDYWGWVLIGGEGLLRLKTLSAQDAIIETAANGEFDDTSGTGLKIGFQTGATVGGSAAGARVKLAGLRAM